tara:strand:- start:500 stop:925 length:426 start_codon:yes stop_codon:yes gene_type:complete
MIITHALVADVTDEILERVDGAKEFRTGVPPIFNGKPLRWLPYTMDDEPIFDADTHIKERSVETVGESEVTLSHPVRALTQAELTSRRQGKIRGLDNTLVRIVEDLMVAVATGEPLTRDTFPAQAWEKINKRRRLRGQADV